METNNKEQSTRKIKLPQLPKIKLPRPRISINAFLKTLVLLVIILWAQHNNLFGGAPGIEALLNIFLNVMNELCGFLADIITKLYEILHIEAIWTFIRSLVK